MNLDWIKVLPSKETPFNKEFFKKLSTSILDYAFPVGKTEIFYDAEDHSNYLGFKWERTALERSPIGYNPDSTDDNYKTIGNKFGENEHKLSIDEMPIHNHGMDFSIVTYGQTGTYPATNSTGNNATGYYTYASNQGGDLPHNTIHPVEVVAFWKRVE